MPDEREVNAALSYQATVAQMAVLEARGLTDTEIGLVVLHDFFVKQHPEFNAQVRLTLVALHLAQHPLPDGDGC